MGNLFLLGIDGLPPAALRRFVGEGIMPNCAKLMAEAARLDVIPTLPAVTAPGWLTIASGAHPATLGISNLLLPTPGEAPDRIRNGFSRTLSNAEYLWEVLADEGLPATVVKYPGSWPPKDGLDSVVQVDGAGGYADITCVFEDLSSTCYYSGVQPPEAAADGCCSVPRGYEDHWRIDDPGTSGWTPATPRDPLNWTGLPDGAEPAFETVLTLSPAGQRSRLLLHALALGGPDGPRLIISPTKDARDAVADLAPGQWSDWVHGESARGPHAYRFKLLELDPRERVLRLYRGEGHRTTGFARPEHIGEELVTAAGPVAEWTGTFDFMNGLIDLDTQLEIYDRHTAWLESVITHLAGRRPARGFFVHWHVVEYAHHIAGASLDPEHPFHERDRDQHLDFLRETYRLLDRLIGTAVAATPQRDAFALVSDHGHDTVHTLFFLNDFLRERGWLTTAPDGEIDWTRTRAYGLFPGMIFLNTAGRWPGGSVPAEEAAALRVELTSALRGLTDPRTGRPVVTAVLGETEMRAFGQAGETAPDLFFTMDKGYEPATRIRTDEHEPDHEHEPGHEHGPDHEHGGGLFELTVPGSELTSGHGSFHPASPSAMTLALIRHPSLTGGAVARHPVSMVDLAPTFAELMGVRPPRRCDGRPLNFSALGVEHEAGTS